MKWLAMCGSLGLVVSGCLPSGGDTPHGAEPDAGGTIDSGSVTFLDGGSGGDADAATPLDAGSDGGQVVNTCTTPTGGPTTHTGGVNTETWTAAASPHLITSDINIYGTLTIEPCAEVQILAGGTVTVGTTGQLIAIGTAAKPIHIGPKDVGKPFARIRSPQGAPLRLAYTLIEGGGDPQNAIPDTAGMIDLQGVDQTKPSQETIAIDHVTLSGSASNGIVLRDGAGFASGSTDLTVTGAAQFPVNVWSRAAGRLPTGSYTGNAHDEILLLASGGYEAMLEDLTIHDRGVPYRVGSSTSAGDLRVGGGLPGSLATLTIEPGVTFRFKKAGVFQVEHFQGTNPATGAIIAVGTAAKPIVFTSAEAAPAAGDWLGITFGQVPAPTDKIDYARVEFAGGVSFSGSDSCAGPTWTTGDAAIRIFGVPVAELVTNTTIVSSAAHGIDRGYRSDTKTDFLATNTFQSVALCKQTYPKNANGTCPTPVPCP